MNASNPRKKKISLTIDKMLLEEAKELGVKLSAFLEIKLGEHLSLVKNNLKCAGRDLNPGQGLGKPLC